jgi:hypothetical protein
MTTMMGRLVLVALLLTPLLGGCGRQQFNASADRQTFRFGGGTTFGDEDVRSDPGRRLAMTYQFTLRVPDADAEAIQQRHLAECKKLGCEILNTSIDRWNEGHVRASVRVRIKPESFDAFAVVLAESPAQITSRSQSAEDLATPIHDLERRLEMKTALRDRLTAMLHDQAVKTAADLIAIEKELGQAQSDIESITTQRDGLRTRTDTVRVEVTYLGAANLLGGTDLTPIYQAVSAINQTTVNSVSWLIATIVAIVPWLPVIALIWWIVRRGTRRWRLRKQ